MKEYLGCKALENQVDITYQELLSDPYGSIRNGLDYELSYDLEGTYLGCKVYFVMGGPTIWLNTKKCVLRGTWGVDEYGKGVDPKICKLVDEIILDM